MSKNISICDGQAVSFTKKIKATVYEVNVFFSKTSKETINDKIIRLIRNEAAG